MFECPRKKGERIRKWIRRVVHYIRSHPDPVGALDHWIRWCERNRRRGGIRARRAIALSSAIENETK